MNIIDIEAAIKTATTDKDISRIFHAAKERQTEIDRTVAKSLHIGMVVKFFSEKHRQTFEGPIENINGSGRVKIKYSAYGTFTCGAGFLKDNLISPHTL